MGVCDNSLEICVLNSCGGPDGSGAVFNSQPKDCEFDPDSRQVVVKGLTLVNLAKQYDI